MDVIAAAQEPNGYLYPSHTTKVGTDKNMMGNTPYTFVVHSHELYNMGHLYEAAIAYYLATGKDKLLKIAEKNAQHVNKVFFEGDPKYNNGKPIRQAPGHQEMELALVKLYQVTGKELYLDMAEKFLEIRGKTYVPDGEGVMSPTYAQQHAPVEDQSEAVGHAVRATYLYSAMADIAGLKQKISYTQALHRIWANITDTRMHITGGLGAVHGIEGFGPKFLLPNADAFNETCAAVGNVLFNFRMFLHTKMQNIWMWRKFPFLIMCSLQLIWRGTDSFMSIHWKLMENILLITGQQDGLHGSEPRAVQVTWLDFCRRFRE